jgi:hypothetical protein
MFLALGGYLVFLGMLPLSKHYEPWSGTFLTILNCSFDSSAIVFIVYLKIYQATKLSVHVFFAILIVVPIITIIGTICWPKDRIVVTDPVPPPVTTPDSPTRLETNVEIPNVDPVIKEEITEVRPPTPPELTSDPVKTEAKSKVNSPPVPQPKPLRWTKEMMTPMFILFVLMWAIHELWINVYVGSVETRISSLSGSKAETVYYLEIFGWILPAQIVIAPLIGVSIDKMGVIWTFVVIQVISVIFTCFLFIPVLWVQILTFLLFALYRGYFFSYCFIFLLQKFQLKNFGRLFGVAALVCGMLTAFQYLIYYIVLVPLKGNYFWANIFQLICLCTTNIFLIYMIYDRIKKRKVVIPPFTQKDVVEEFKQLDETDVYISPREHQ